MRVRAGTLTQPSPGGRGLGTSPFPLYPKVLVLSARFGIGRSYRPTLPILASALLVGAAHQGCTRTDTLGPFSDLEKARSRPDGVAVDPESPPPRARDSAEVTGALVTLRTPLGVDRAVGVVEELFRRILLEDAEGLDALFVNNAVAVTGFQPGAETQRAVTWWASRFRKLDYTKLAGETIYRTAEFQIYRGSNTADPPPHSAIHTDGMEPNDVVLAVPILTARVGVDRLFGDEMILWLRRDGDRYRIYRMLEDFQLN